MFVAGAGSTVAGVIAAHRLREERLRQGLSLSHCYVTDAVNFMKKQTLAKQHLESLKATGRN